MFTFAQRVGLTLRAMRENRGVLGVDIAGALGLTHGAYELLERGVVAIDVQQLHTACAFMRTLPSHVMELAQSRTASNG